MKGFVYKLQYVIEESVSILWGGKSLNFLTVFVVAFTFFVLFFFSFFSYNLNMVVKNLKKEAKLELYFKNGSDSKVKFISSEIEKFEFVNRVKFVSSKDAYRNFLKDFPSLENILKELKENPFPPKIIVYLKKDFNKKDRERLFDYVNSSGLLENVKDNESVILKIRKIVVVSNVFGYFFGGILVFASLFTIVNVLRILILSRKAEINILDLIGASPIFIEMPFLIETTIIVLFGGMLSILFLKLSFIMLPYYAHDFYAFINPFVKTMVFPLKTFFIYIVVGLVVAIASVHFSIKNLIFIETS